MVGIDILHFCIDKVQEAEMLHVAVGITQILCLMKVYRTAV